MLEPRQFVCAGTQKSFTRERMVTIRNNQPATNRKAAPLMQ